MCSRFHVTRSLEVLSCPLYWMLLDERHPVLVLINRCSWSSGYGNDKDCASPMFWCSWMGSNNAVAVEDSLPCLWSLSGLFSSSLLLTERRSMGLDRRLRCLFLAVWWGR